MVGIFQRTSAVLVETFPGLSIKNPDDISKLSLPPATPYPDIPSILLAPVVETLSSTNLIAIDFAPIDKTEAISLLENV